MQSRKEFERVVLPHLEAAYTLAYWLLGSRPDAEDVVQDALLQAYRAFAGFRGGDSKPWLLTIVRNAAYRTRAKRKRMASVICLDTYQRATGTPTGDPMDVSDGTPTAEDRLVKDDEQKDLNSALAELPDVFREVVVLREIEGLSYREIAEVSGIPVGTVMSRLSRARRDLAATLKRIMAKDEGHAM